MSPRTPEQNKEIRKQTVDQILNAAFELFANNGYSHTSISSIAGKAGISKGLIYHYFDSKESILEGLFKQLIAMGNKLMVFPDGLSAKEKFRQMIEDTFAFIKENSALSRLMISLVLQPETLSSVSPIIESSLKEQFISYTSLFKELGIEDAEIEAYRIGAQLDGIVLGYITIGEDYPLEAIKQKIINDYV